MTDPATSRASWSTSWAHVRSKADIGRAWLVDLVWSGLVVDEGALLQDQVRRAEEMRQLLRSVDWYGLLKESRSFLWLQWMYGCMHVIIIVAVVGFAVQRWHEDALGGSGSDWPSVDIGTARSEDESWPAAACRSPLAALVPALARVPCRDRAGNGRDA